MASKNFELAEKFVVPCCLLLTPKNRTPKLLPVAFWRRFITANVKLLDRIGEKFSNAGLPTMDWYDVLLMLKEAPEHRLRLSDLAQKALLSRRNLTHLLDRLEKAGLLYRERCPRDRRGKYAVLTEAGLEMQQKMWAVYSEGIAQYFGSHLSDEELEVMQRVLERILKAA